MTRLVTADASRISGADFIRIIRGLPPLSAAARAEAEARDARLSLLRALERGEFAKARREREEIQRQGMAEGESYAQFVDRAFQPMVEARQRVDARMAAWDRKAAA
jgi:hypothetical protein